MESFENCCSMFPKCSAILQISQKICDRKTFANDFRFRHIVTELSRNDARISEILIRMMLRLWISDIMNVFVNQRNQFTFAKTSCNLRFLSLPHCHCFRCEERDPGVGGVRDQRVHGGRERLCRQRTPRAHTPLESRAPDLPVMRSYA